MNEPVRILIVEDKPADFELARREIRKAVKDCEIQQVETRQAYSEALETFQPDLIISDNRLPRFNGMEALALARERLPMTPLIIWTGSLSEDIAVDFMRAGANNYVVKDNLKRLAPAVLHALDERQVLLGRKRAEEALRVSEERLNLALTGANDGLWDWNVQTGEAYFSPRWKAMLGYADDELPNTYEAWDSRLHPDDKPRVLKALQEHFDDESRTYAPEFRMLTQAGEWLWIRARGRVVERDPEGRPLRMAGTHTDITEHKQAEEALREAHTFARQIIDSLPHGVNVRDAEHRYRAWNPFMERMLGTPADQVIGRTMAEAFPDISPAAVDTVLSGLRRALAGESVATPDVRIERKGKVSWTTATHSPLRDSAGEIVGTISIVEDITERKQAEEKLRASETKFRNIIDESPVPYALNDDQQNITYLNPAFIRTFGYDLEDIPTLADWWPRAYPDAEYRQWVAETWQARLNKSKQSGAPFEPLELNIHCKDGVQRTVIVGAASLTESFAGVHLVILFDITERKQAEEKLRASEDFRRLIVDTEPECVKLIAPNGGLIEMNSAGLAMIEADSLEQVQGALMIEIVAPEYRDAFGNLHKRVMRGEFGMLEFEIIGLKGGRRWLETHAVPLRNESNQIQALLGVTRDITERKQAEEKLREQQAFQKNIMDGMLAFVGLFSLDGILLEANRAALSAVGLEAEEVIGKPFADLYWWSHSEATQAQVREALRRAASGEPVRADFLARVVGNQMITVDIVFNPLRDSSGQIIQVVGSGVDITARKQAEEKVERQNQRLKALREIDTAILAADSVESIVGAALSHIRELIECRRANLTLIDWGTNELVIFEVRTLGETSIPTGRRLPLAQFEDIIQTLSQNQPILFSDLRALANPRPGIQALLEDGLRSTCSLPLFSQGNLIGMFSMHSEIPGFFDEEKIGLTREVANQVAIAITQNNLLEALRDFNAELEGRVSERTAQLQAANKELEAFSYSVSHDLRAPLRGIDGFSQALTRKYIDALGEDGKHYITRIQENARYMGQLIDDLLSLARITRREMKQDDVNLSKMAREIADELQSSQEPGRRVEFEIEEQVEARGDAGLLRLVLQNLLGNAWKFTSTREETRIHFGITRAERSASGDEAQFSNSLSTTETVYCIRDNGVGFDMSYADKLFGAFQRLHAADEFPGAGIGLATVQRIVHRHGGRIWVEAQVDKGAAFYFTLG